MEPIKFPEVNAMLVKPESMTDEDCGSLPVHRGADPHIQGGSVIISAWKMTAEELEEFQRTGTVWMWVFGRSQPPIALSPISPFQTTTFILNGHRMSAPGRTATYEQLAEWSEQPGTPRITARNTRLTPTTTSHVDLEVFTGMTIQFLDEKELGGPTIVHATSSTPVGEGHVFTADGYCGRCDKHQTDATIRERCKPTRKEPT